jgi:hypothetical protein
MMASLERTLVLLYRRHFEHYVLEVTVLRAEAALERAGLARRRPVRPRPSLGGVVGVRLTYAAAMAARSGRWPAR